MFDFIERATFKLFGKHKSDHPNSSYEARIITSPLSSRITAKDDISLLLLDGSLDWPAVTAFLEQGTLLLLLCFERGVYNT